jgi:hypothetical protein
LETAVEGTDSASLAGVLSGVMDLAEEADHLARVANEEARRREDVLLSLKVALAGLGKPVRLDAAAFGGLFPSKGTVSFGVDMALTFAPRGKRRSTLKLDAVPKREFGRCVSVIAKALATELEKMALRKINDERPKFRAQIGALEVHRVILSRVEPCLRILNWGGDSSAVSVRVELDGENRYFGPFQLHTGEDATCSFGSGNKISGLQSIHVELRSTDASGHLHLGEARLPLRGYRSIPTRLAQETPQAWPPGMAPQARSGR